MLRATPYTIRPARLEDQGEGGYACKAGIIKRVNPHILRHCLATHLPDNDTNIRLLQELPGYKNLKATIIYTHLTTKTLEAIQSPLDQLFSGDNHWKKTKE